MFQSSQMIALIILTVAGNRLTSLARSLTMRTSDWPQKVTLTTSHSRKYFSHYSFPSENNFLLGTDSNKKMLLWKGLEVIFMADAWWHFIVTIFRVSRSLDCSLSLWNWRAFQEMLCAVRWLFALIFLFPIHDSLGLIIRRIMFQSNNNYIKIWQSTRMQTNHLTTIERKYNNSVLWS